MKTTSFLTQAAVAIFLVGVAPITPADEAPAGTKSGAAPSKKVRPHSHAEEKTGLPAQPVAEPKAGATDEKMKKDQHLHPRDGK